MSRQEIFSPRWEPLDLGQQYLIRQDMAIANRTVRVLAKFYSVSEQEIRDVVDRKGNYAN
jgi:hypothetical protein